MVDDYTFEVQTIGVMPTIASGWIRRAVRSASRHASQRRFVGVDYDTLVWSETIDDPKVLHAPWEAIADDVPAA
jgi:hypothetical protein